MLFYYQLNCQSLNKAKEIFVRVNPWLSCLLLLTGLLGFYKLYSDFQVAFSGVYLRNIIGGYCFAVMVLYGFVSLLLLTLKPQKQTRQKIILVCVSIVVTLLICELGLRVLRINFTYSELRWGKYVSPYIRRDEDTLHIILPKFPLYLETPEFKYPRKRNNMGFRDYDFSENQDTSKILIQTYGDSFTEGDGAPMDSSYPAALRKILSTEYGSRFIVQNFGVCGGDPAFYFKQFEHIGLQLHPAVIIVNYCVFDYTVDYFTRGGLERFKDGYVESLPPPAWEMLFAYSYISRAVIIPFTGKEYTYSFVTQKERELRLKQLEKAWNETFQKFAALAEKNGIKVLLVKKPESAEVIRDKYDYDFSFFERGVVDSMTLKQFDLISYYRDSAGFNKNNLYNYYWRQDGHHNGSGYQVMAKGVYAGLRQSYPEIFPILDAGKK